MGREALQSQRESGAGLLACESDGDHRGRALVEYVVAQDQNGPLARLLPSTRRTQVGPSGPPSRYSGHVSRLPARPSSAKAASSLGSSLAHSSARRVRPNRSRSSTTALNRLAPVAETLLSDKFIDTTHDVCLQCQSHIRLRHGSIISHYIE